jgi:transcriptional regulator with XRE-family HTH domain
VKAVATRRRGFVALRKAAGYTQESLAADMNVDRSTIIRWEAGETEPLPYHRPKLARLLGVSADELRQVLTDPDHEVSPGTPSAAVELLNSTAPAFDRRAVLASSAAAALMLGDVETLRRELAEAVDHAAMSDASLDDWEHTVHQYSFSYRYRPPSSLLVDMTADFAELGRVLERRRAILVPTRLTRVVAQMAGLMCGLMIRLDQHAAARNWARTAKTVAKECGDSKLHAWVLSQEAYSHYYDGNPIRAIFVAAQAQHVANHTPCTGVVQGAAIEARVHALHGRAQESQAALDRTERALSGLDAEARMPSAFGYDEARFAHHVSNAYTHLGRTTEAVSAQDRALALYIRTDYFNRPLVMLDRADCFVQDNDVPAAAEAAKQALCTFGAEQRTPVVDNRAREVLNQIPAKAATLPAVMELRDLLHETATTATLRSVKL